MEIHYTFVGGLVAFGAKGHFGVSFSTATLAALAQENHIPRNELLRKWGARPSPSPSPNRAFQTTRSSRRCWKHSDRVNPVRLHGIIIAEALLRLILEKMLLEPILLRTS